MGIDQSKRDCGYTEDNLPEFYAASDNCMPPPIFRSVVPLPDGTLKEVLYIAPRLQSAKWVKRKCNIKKYRPGYHMMIPSSLEGESPVFDAPHGVTVMQDGSYAFYDSQCIPHLVTTENVSEPKPHQNDIVPADTSAPALTPFTTYETETPGVKYKYYTPSTFYTNTASTATPPTSVFSSPLAIPSSFSGDATSYPMYAVPYESSISSAPYSSLPPNPPTYTNYPQYTTSTGQSIPSAPVDRFTIAPTPPTTTAGKKTFTTTGQDSSSAVKPPMPARGRSKSPTPQSTPSARARSTHKTTGAPKRLPKSTLKTSVLPSTTESTAEGSSQYYVPSDPPHSSSIGGNVYTQANPVSKPMVGGWDPNFASRGLSECDGSMWQQPLPSFRDNLRRRMCDTPLYVHTTILPPGVSADDPRIGQGRVVSERRYSTNDLVYPEDDYFFAHVHPALHEHENEPVTRLVTPNG